MDIGSQNISVSFPYFEKIYTIGYLSYFMENFDPDIPEYKRKSLEKTLKTLLMIMETRLEENGPKDDVHWHDDYPHYHIEKSYGEFATAYTESKRGHDIDRMFFELADGMNHILMAADTAFANKEHIFPNRTDDPDR